MEAAMKTAMTLGLAALLATAGVAMADGPMVLTDAELDRVTGGPRMHVFVDLHNQAPAAPNTAENVEIVFGSAPEGTILHLELTHTNPGTERSNFTGFRIIDVSAPNIPR
jgi:hypothetical protein